MSAPWHLVARSVECSDLVCSACWPVYQAVIRNALTLGSGAMTIMRLVPMPEDAWRCTICSTQEDRPHEREQPRDTAARHVAH